VRDDQDPLHVEQVGAEDEGLHRGDRDAATRVPEDLGVAGLEAEHAQRVDAAVHARHDGHSRAGDAVEPGELEVGGVVGVGGQEVVEVTHGR